MSHWKIFQIILEELIELAVPLSTQEQLSDKANLFIKHIQQASMEQ